MTLQRLFFLLIRVALLAIAVEVAACLALTLRPSLCRSGDAVALLRVPADACQAAKRIGARCDPRAIP